jgi:hypothetical protein
MAGDYLADEMASLGLGGAGVDGGYFQPFSNRYRNVLGMLKGHDSEFRDQYILVTAHYDHVGYGTKRSSRGGIGQVHNGADDNASGTSGLLELAEAFCALPEPPRRSVVFVGWDAEEKGLLGSLHWRSHPTLPLDKVVFAVTMDMIGSLRDDCLTIHGTRSAYGTRRLLSSANQQQDLKLVFDWTLKASSDHHPLFERGIPVLLFHTGLTDHYHTPRDDAHRINADGMRRVTRMMFEFLYDMANADRTPRFRPQANRETETTRRRQDQHSTKLPSRLGVSWSRESNGAAGLQLTRVVPDSPGEQASLVIGDRILQVNGREVYSSEDLIGAVATAASPAHMLVQPSHGEIPVELAVQLRGKPLRLGITWRVDEAEPGSLILTSVVAGTPAALAGLRAGDRIYQIADRDFANEVEFARLAAILPGPLRLAIERNGRISTVQLHFDRLSSRKAA